MISLVIASIFVYYNIVLFEKIKYVALTTTEQQTSIITNIILIVIIYIILIWTLYELIVKYDNLK